MKKYLTMAAPSGVSSVIRSKAALLAVVGLAITLAGLAAGVKVAGASASGFLSGTIAWINGNGTPPPLPPGNVVVETLPDVRQAASQAAAQAQVTVLAYDIAHGMSRVAVSKAAAAGRCMVIGDGTKIPGFWNSGKNAAGQIFWFWDTRTTTVCRFGNVWRKVGPHNCGNLVRFTMPEEHVVHGIVVMIRAFGRFHASVTAHASASANDWCGSASASASGSASVSGSTRMQARGNARLVASVRATVNASAKASASVSCGNKPPVVTVTTPGGTTTVSTPPPPPVTVTTGTTQTVTTSTTTTTTTTTPGPFTCQMFVPLVSKTADPYTATATFTANGGSISSTRVDWGDGAVTSGGTSQTHTYAKPSPGPAGFVQYVISSTATASDGRSASCGSAPFNVPIPSPYGGGSTTTTNGTTTTNPEPPLPGG